MIPTRVMGHSISMLALLLINVVRSTTRSTASLKDPPDHGHHYSRGKACTSVHDRCSKPPIGDIEARLHRPWHRGVIEVAMTLQDG